MNIFNLADNENKPISVIEQIGLYLFIFSLPWPIKFTNISIGLIILNYFFYRRYHQTYFHLKDSKIFFSLIAYYASIAISLAYSGDIPQGTKALETRLPLIIIPVILSGYPWTVRLRNNILRIYVLTMVLISVYSIISTIRYYKIDFSDWSYFSWVLTDTVGLSPNHYSIYISFALFFLISGFKDLKLFNWQVTILLSVYLIAFLGVLSSRMAFFLFVFITLCQLVYTFFSSTNKREKTIVLSVAIGISLTASIAVFTVPYLKDRVNQLSRGLSRDPRFFTILSSYEIIKAHPLLGVGIGDVQTELNEQYKKLNFEEGLANEYNPHNDWVNSYLAGGLLTFTSLLSLYFFLIVRMKGDPDFFGLAFILFFILASQTESLFNRYKGCLIFATLLTLIFIVDLFSKKNNEANA